MVKSDKEKKANQKSKAAANPQAEGPSGKEATLSPPPLSFGKEAASEKTPAEDKEKKKAEGKEKGETQDDNNFDIDFELLPPEIKLKIFELGMDADTKGVSISHKAKAFNTKFDFEYKGKASLNLDHGDLNHTLGYDIGSKNLSYGGKYQDWNWGSNYNFNDNSVGLSIGYGAGLRPSREERANNFGNKMKAGFEGAEGAIGSLGSAFDDPVKYAEDQKDNIKAITKAVSEARKLSKMKNSTKTEFGAGLRFGYSQDSGVSIFVGAQLRF